MASEQYHSPLKLAMHVVSRIRAIYEIRTGAYLNITVEHFNFGFVAISLFNKFVRQLFPWCVIEEMYQSVTFLDETTLK